jgi:hypothetical protein
MEYMAFGSPSLRCLLRMSWRSLILMAVADVQSFCSPKFLADIEPYSSFRFGFIQARNEGLASRQAIIDVLFDAFVEAGSSNRGEPSLPRGCCHEFAVRTSAASESQKVGDSFA